MVPITTGSRHKTWQEADTYLRMKKYWWEVMIKKVRFSNIEGRSSNQPATASSFIPLFSLSQPETSMFKLLGSPGIDSQPGGPLRQPYLTYRPARLHMLAELILCSLNVYKFRLSLLKPIEGGEINKTTLKGARASSNLLPLGTGRSLPDISQGRGEINVQSQCLDQLSFRVSQHPHLVRITVTAQRLLYSK